MNVLAFETSSELCSVALWRDGAIAVAERDTRTRNHSELLLPMAEALLAGQGLGYDDLHGIAFGAGPGSFTGLRIGCGVAQGLAFGLGLPVAGVVTLEAMAEAAGADRVVVCLDARMGEVYHAAYRRGPDGWETLSEPGLYAPQEIPQLPGEWVGAGSGFAMAHEALAARLGEALVATLPQLVPHARQVALLGARILAAGGGSDPADALPLYIRDKVALTTAERAA